MSDAMAPAPMFKKLAQVALVVKDLEAATRRYWHDFGIGPWKFYTLDRTNTPDMTLRGSPVAQAFRVAIAVIGEMELELIQPMDENTLYAEHLARHGEGLHHIAFEVENFDQTRTRLIEKGYAEIQGGRPFDVCTYAYFDTQEALGCITELGCRTEGKSFPPPQSTYP